MEVEDEALRLGQLLIHLQQAATSLRSGRTVASPTGMLRQPLEGGPHPGHWLTRHQIYDLSKALREVDRIAAEVRERVWPKPTHVICPIVIADDDSIGGEGKIRCRAKGFFLDDRSAWHCDNGHTLDRQAPDCKVERCPCPELQVVVEHA